MSKKLDLTKPVQTRDGRNVRILCTDASAWNAALAIKEGK